MVKISREVQDFLIKEFYKLNQKVKLIFFTQEFKCPHCVYTREILDELGKFSNKIVLEVNDFQKNEDKVKKYKIDKIPAIVVEGAKDYGIRYFGVPSG